MTEGVQAANAADDEGEGIHDAPALAGAANASALPEVGRAAGAEATADDGGVSAAASTPSPDGAAAAAAMEAEDMDFQTSQAPKKSAQRGSKTQRSSRRSAS